MAKRQTRLDTPRLILREPVRRDAPALAEFLTRNWEFHRPWEPLRTAEYFTRAAQRQMIRESRRDHTRVSWVMHLTGESVRAGVGAPIVGTISLSCIVMGFFRSGFLGYRVDQQFARQGLMSEAVAAVVDHAFGQMGLHRIEANCMPVNEPSIGLLRKLGFVDEGTGRRYLQIQGRWRDHRHLVLLAEDWTRAGDGKAPLGPETIIGCEG